MSASTRLRTVGAAVAGCLLAMAAPGTPARAAAPPITVSMTASATTPPSYQIQVHNDTDGMVKTTVRQDLPPGARTLLVSQGGQVTPADSQAGRAGSEVIWQVQLGARGTAVLTSTLAAPPNGGTIIAPACAFVANGSMVYDCASAAWDPANPGGGTAARAESDTAGAWWRRTTVLSGAALALLVLAGVGYLLWRRRTRRRGPADPPERPVEPGRVVRRSGNPIARARARVPEDAKIPAPADFRSGAEPVGAADARGDAAAEEPVVEGGLLADGGLARPDGPADDLVGIAGGARYVGRAPIPPRTPAPRRELDAEQLPAEQPAGPPYRAVGRARSRSGATFWGLRRPRPPVWLAVGLAAALTLIVLASTTWTASTQVSEISADREPSSGAWVGRTAAGPVGTALRESAFEFTVYRLNCPTGSQGCRAIVGMRNLTDRGQLWYGQLQRAYLPNGDWVSADVPATRIANAGQDPFAEPVPAGERMIIPLVFAPTGTVAPTRIELRSAVFSAGVSVDVPH